MKCIQFDKEKKYIKDFLYLPKKLYNADTNMENPEEVTSLLMEEHPISRYFHLDKFIVYDVKKVVGRFCITTYEEDEAAYIGFFECVERPEVAKFIFDYAYEFAKKKGFIKIVGPVDASFWIKYRLKINCFDKEPYTGEPYNKDYYYTYFLENGYEVIEHYNSSMYKVVREKDPLYEERYQKLIEKGYSIISPKAEDFDKVLKELYRMITDLYRTFPIYKDLDYEEFKAVFSDYRYILNMDMVKMAYFNGEAVGFFVGVPNYGNKVYHLKNPLNLFKILMKKRKADEYIMLYMGVDRKHLGLGRALVASMMNELREKEAKSIGALVKDGKVSQFYARDLIYGKYEYALFCKEIASDR